MQSLRTLSLINKIIGITALNDKIMQTSESYFSCQSIFLYILWSYSFHNCLVTNVATLLNNKCCRECHAWRWNHVWKFLYNIRNNNINSSYLIMEKKKKTTLCDAKKLAWWQKHENKGLLWWGFSETALLVSQKVEQQSWSHVISEKELVCHYEWQQIWTARCFNKYLLLVVVMAFWNLKEI